MSKHLKAIGVLSVVCALSAAIAFAQDPCKVAPSVYKVMLDNERVRVLHVTVKPGESIPIHSHPDYSLYVISGGTGRFFSSASDTGVVAELRTGDVSWHNAETHAAKNTGTSTIQVVLTELKEPKPVVKKEGK